MTTQLQARNLVNRLLSEEIVAALRERGMQVEEKQMRSFDPDAINIVLRGAQEFLSVFGDIASIIAFFGYIFQRKLPERARVAAENPDVAKGVNEEAVKMAENIATKFAERENGDLKLTIRGNECSIEIKLS